MLITILTGLSAKVFHFIEKQTHGPLWILKLTVVCVLLYCFTSFPKFDIGADAPYMDYWGFLDEKIDNPFLPHRFTETAPSSNLAKRAFRLTMPVIGHVFGLRAGHLFIIQACLGVLFFSLIAKLTEKITQDRVITVLITLGIGFTYVGKACFWDVKYGWFDGVAYFFLVAAMLSQNVVLVGLFTFLACWVDERAVLASFLVFLWWKIQEEGIDSITIKSFLRLGRRSTAVVFIWLSYGFLRFWLHYQFGLKTPMGSSAHVGLSVFVSNFLEFFSVGFLSPLEFFIVLLASSCLILYKQKAYLLCLLLGGVIFFMLLVSFTVGDMTRSACYVFPSIFIALNILTTTEKKFVIQLLALGIALGNFIIGTYFIMNVVSPIAPSFKFFFLLKDWLT